jgi:putative ABC transport system permease protein
MAARRLSWEWISAYAYRLLLATYPPDMRREYGREMAHAFKRQCGDDLMRGGVRGLWRLWRSTLRDYVVTILAEWRDRLVQAWRGRRRPKRTDRRRLDAGQRGIEMLASLMSDVRYAVRQLVRRPGFTVVAVATLAIGIGANTAIFSVVNAVVLRPLAFEDPDRIVMVWENNLERGYDRFTVSPANFVDWRERGDAFDDLAAYTGGSHTLTGHGAPTRLTVTFVSASLFSVLGVRPFLGRGFASDENDPGRDGVVVLSHIVWENRFGGDPGIIGRTILLDGNATEVIGVMPPDFAFRRQTEAWRPLSFDFDVSESRGAHYLRVLGKIKESFSVQQAEAAMGTLAGALEQEYPNINSGWGAVVVPLHEQIVGNVRRALAVLFGAVTVVLLIACANVANLLLSRSSSRQQELAVRAALGAGRRRLLRQLLTESVTLALVGGTAGILLAFAGLQVLVALNPGNLPRMEEIGVDGSVLLFALLAAILTGVVFGLVPAFHSSRSDLYESLKVGGGRTSGSVPGHRAKSLLVVSEVALALILVVGSGLLIQSFRRLQAVDPGFNADNAIAMQISPPESRYPETEHISTFYRTLLEQLETVPGISSVGAATGLPMRGRIRFSFSVVGRPAVPGSQQPSADFRTVSPDYFRTMGIPLLRGRGFTSGDDARAPSVVIINENLARQHFPDEEPLGQALNISTSDAPCPCEIVGVVADVRQRSLEQDAQAGYYLPAAQAVWRSMVVVARTPSNPTAVVPAMRQVVSAIDPDLAVYDVETLENRLSQSIARPRFNTVMLGVFAAVALLLAMVGIYGVMSYAVSQRRNELGIRVALGARTGEIIRLVVGRALGLTGAGIVIGLAGAYGTTRFLASMLFDVNPLDPATFAVVTAVLIGVAVLASYLPARRAARVDPVTALRSE